jgi:outer membrane protein assembly factor BamB
MNTKAVKRAFDLGILLVLAATLLGCTKSSPEFEYVVPMDAESPWPKFRRTASQTGRSPVLPIDTGAAPWVFPTGKGIFSTAVIDGDNNVYVGSGDRAFYKLDKNGKELWSVLTGEVVDSSALLDDQGAVYFGSGDGFLYALNREDGSEIWKFEADPPSLHGALINWFEGNVAMGVDGTLYVPNDNRCTYAIDRNEGTSKWCFVTLDQTWSLPALNHETDRLFMGSNNPLAASIFGIGAGDASALWFVAVQATVAASPMVATTDPDGLVTVGGFDGFLHGLRQSDGTAEWSFGARDHIYASPAQAEDGTIIQPSADGTIYAIDPATGSVVWAYDTREPIRSSPAIDGKGNIYVGSGEGQMFVLNPNGSLRWSIKLIDDERDDLNSSPALGKEFVVLSGESGEVFGIPYDYCLRENLQDPRCTIGPGEPLPDEGVFRWARDRHSERGHREPTADVHPLRPGRRQHEAHRHRIRQRRSHLDRQRRGDRFRRIRRSPLHHYHSEDAVGRRHGRHHQGAGQGELPRRADGTSGTEVHVHPWRWWHIRPDFRIRYPAEERNRVSIPGGQRPRRRHRHRRALSYRGSPADDSAELQPNRLRLDSLCDRLGRG